MRNVSVKRMVLTLSRRVAGSFLISIAAFLSPSLQAAATFIETGGIVVIEAEHFDSRTTATDNNHRYVLIPDEASAADLAAPAGQFKNARGGRYMTALPDSGENRNTTDLQAAGPNINYKVQISTPGEYQLYLRSLGYDGASDSFYASIVELKPASGGPGPEWYRLAPNPDTGDFATLQNLPFDGTTTAGWTGNGNPEVSNGGDGGDDAPVVWTISKAGAYTISVQQREDGNGLDALILQLSSKPVPSNPGPAESGVSAGFLIGVHPSDQITTPGKTATFTVTPLVPTGTAVTYQWQQKAPGATTFTPVSGATSASYTTPTATDAMNGTQYRVTLTSGGTTLTSGAATLITDAAPPTVVGAFGSPDLKGVTIRFSEMITQITAETLANYTITGLTLSAPKLQANGTDVVLTTTPQTATTPYTITINGVKDVAGNALVNGQAKFAGATLTAGGILQKYWNNITGNNIAALRADTRFPDSPTFSTIEPRLEYPPNGANEAGSNYGNMLAGWLVPTVTADYVFFTCSDDPNEFYLSTDDNPANKKLIAQETAWSNARQWTTSGGSSDLSSKRSDQFAATEWPGGNTIRLTAGKSYYIEALHTEGGGGDNVGITWKKAGDPDPADGSGPIEGAFLRTIADPTGAITFTQQPSNQTVQASTPVTFTVGFTAFSAFGTTGLIQWQKAPAGSTNYADIAGATSANYKTDFAAASDNGAKFRAVVTAAGTTATSSAATLTVNTDTVPPTLVSLNANSTTITLAFSEPLDAASAAAKVNYTLSGGATVSTATLNSAAGAAGVVKLDASGLTPGQSYTLIIIGVKDASGNAVAAGTAKTFTVYHISENFNAGVAPAGSAVSGTVSFPSDGTIQLTPNAGSSQGSIIFTDPLSGGSVTKFTATFKLFIGNGSGNAADGFSFNIGSDVIADVNNPSNFGEEGAGSGFRVAFDTYDNGGGEAPSISIYWAGTETSIKTNFAKAVLVNNRWVDVAIQVTSDGKVTVQHDNVKYFDQVPIDGWAPIASPQVGLGARTGGEFETHRVDDLNVLFNADLVLPVPPIITLTSPTNGATYAAGANITATVNATAPGGSITKVTYYANGSKLADVTTAPYSLTIPNVAAGDYLVYATVTAVNGITVQSKSARIIVGNLPSKILFVTTDPGPLTVAGDQAILARLQSRGLTVDLSTGTALPSDGSAAQGYGAVIISSSLGSGTVGDKLQTAPIPVMDWESALTDNFRFQADDATKGTSTAQTDITIVDATSPLAAGLSAGAHTVLSAPENMSWGTPLGEVHIVASMTDDPTRANIFYYDAGAKGLNGFVMPARRAYFFFEDNTARSANADAWKLFDAAVDWLRGASGTANPPSLTLTRGAGNTLTASWTNGGTLQSTASLTAPITWTDVTSTSPFTITAATGTRFYRVR